MKSFLSKSRNSPPKSEKIALCHLCNIWIYVTHNPHSTISFLIEFPFLKIPFPSLLWLTLVPARFITRNDPRHYTASVFQSYLITEHRNKFWSIFCLWKGDSSRFVMALHTKVGLGDFILMDTINMEEFIKNLKLRCGIFFLNSGHSYSGWFIFLWNYKDPKILICANFFLND